VVQTPDDGAFDLSVAARRLSLGRSLLDALLRAPESVRVEIGIAVLLHELYHFDQNLHTTTYRGIGRAGFVLEELDYWADVFVTYSLAKLAILRRGEDGREDARKIVVSAIDANLAGIEAFDRAEQPDQLVRLSERRLRRYLIWHLHRARAEALTSSEQINEIFEQRLVVELSLLQGELDERGDKLVTSGKPETELVAALGGKLLRMPKSAFFDPARLVDAVRSFNRDELVSAMCTVRDHCRLVLVPWVR
jgi:hypothetical protein